MQAKSNNGFGLRQLRFYTLLLVLCWLIAAAISLAWNLAHHQDETKNLAIHVARSHYHKDILYRRWNATHGGVYALVTPETPPNPYLAKLQVPEITITTPSERLLTLINPAYMTRQVYELATDEYDIRGHMSSLKPLRPENSADAWEKEALLAFTDGRNEVSAIIEETGKPYLRLMRSFLAEQSCLHCHDQQGYKVGDVVGGISIKVPLPPFEDMAQKHLRTIWLGHIFFTLLGLTGIFIGFLSLKKRIIERDQSEEKLCQAYGEIEKRVAQRTQELADSNALLKEEIKNRQQLSKEKTTLEAQLRQSQKMEAIGTLSGGIAHDFNNILTPILGYAELLTEELPPEGKSANHLQNILQAAERARDLVKQILTFSRQTEHDLQPLNIQLIIKECLKLLRASIPTTIEIRQYIDPRCGAVLADPTQIHQVVMNLCTNAYHAMRETGGILDLSLLPVEINPDDFLTELDLKPGPYVKLKIRDSGHGIEKDVLERIFEPYFTTKKKGEGTGMGLAVVHGIVKSLAGHITATSEVGKGTTFQIYLPSLAETTRPTEGAGQAPLPTGQETIMVVDDEIEIVKLEQSMLEVLGYRVVSFDDSQAAFDAFREKPADVDLVITDMAMPKLTGTQLAQKIKSINPNTPIILCSGYSDIVDEQKAKSIGIREYLMKPISQKNLATLVRTVLDQQ